MNAPCEHSSESSDSIIAVCGLNTGVRRRSLLNRVLKGLSLLGELAGGGEFTVRDGRFSNGMIIGGKQFVNDMARRHALCFGEIAVKVKPHILGLTKTYATHGQRSLSVTAA